MRTGEEQEPLRVAALVRVSTTHLEQKESPQHQFAYIQEEARRAGWVEAGLTYEAELTGAVIIDRPEIRRLVADARSGRFDAVVMKSISRLGRDTLGLLMVKRMLDDVKVELIALADSYRSFRDPELIFLVHAERAQAGRQEIAKNVRAGILQAAKRGLWPAGTLPFGLCKRTRFEIRADPETAPIVRLIFDLRQQGNGAVAICRYLNNEARIKAPAWWHLQNQIRSLEATADAEKDDRIVQRLRLLRTRLFTGNPLWQPRTIRLMLANTAYYGELRYNRTTGERQMHGRLVRQARRPADWLVIPCEPILSRAEWERAQAAGRSRQRLPRKSPGSPFLLSGLIFCGQCGGAMRGSAARPGAGKRGGDPKGYYVCRSSLEAGAHASEYFRAHALEEAVLGRLRGELAGLAAAIPTKMGRSTRQANPAEQIAAMEAALRDLAEARFFRREELRRDRIRPDQFDFEMRLLEQREEEVRRRIAVLKQEPAQDAERLLQAQAVQRAAQMLVQLSGPPECLKMLLPGLIQKVVVHAGGEAEVYTTFTADEAGHW